MMEPASTLAQTAQPSRLVALDAWRGIAALMVALYRLEADGWLHSLSLVRNAWLFVDFFFVLSGFVIAHAYLDRLGSTRQTAVFIIRRVGRVWPLHVALLLAFVLLELARALLGTMKGVETSAFTEHRAPLTILWDVLLVQALGITGPTWWNTPAWSISTEFWTYIIFAILCFGGRRFVTFISPIIVVTGVGAVAWLSPFAMDTTFDFGLFRCLAGFFTGVLVSIGWQGFARNWQPSVLLATGLEAAIALLALTFVASVDKGPFSLLAPAVFAALVFAFAIHRGVLARALSGATGRLLGDLSYSIYMTALLISLAFNKLPVLLAAKLGHDIEREHLVIGHPHTSFDIGLPLANDAYALVYLAGVLGVSWLTYRYIETPARAWFNRLSLRVE